MQKKSGTIENLAWKFAERISVQLISLVVSIILARILSPEDYGVVAFVMIFITLANVLVSEGLGSSLIQKKSVTAIDYYSVLYFNIVFSFLIYLFIYLTAPLIAQFYGSGYELLPAILRVLGIRVIIMAINSVQQAYISRKMIFKKFFLSTFWGTLFSGIIGICMAYKGFGVWALVVQSLAGDGIRTIVLAFYMKKTPRFLFSFKSIKELIPYSMRILGTGLLGTGYQEIRALIIGKIYATKELAFYDKGRNFPQLIVTNINASIGAVLFPKMSNEQDDIKKVKATMKNSMKFSSYLMCPMMLGLAAVAETFVIVVLSRKWLPCVPLLQWFCIFYLFQPLHTANIQATKAMGRSDIVLKLEFLKDAIQLISLLCTFWISVKAIVISMAVTSVILTYINVYPNSKLCNYGFIEQMQDILPNIFNSAIMFLCVWSIGWLNINDLLKLLIQCSAGIIIYITLSHITKNEQFMYIKYFIKRRK